MMTVSSNDLVLLREGMPPQTDSLLMALTVGAEIWSEFFLERALTGYVGRGGSKVKFLVGAPGTGKTHTLRYLCLRAADMGFASCYVDMTTVRMQYFHQLYGAIAAGIDVPSLIADFASHVIRRLGYDPADIPESPSFARWMEEQRTRPREALMREVRDETDSEIADHQFTSAFGNWVRALVLDHLGESVLPVAERTALLDWFQTRKALRRDLKQNHIYTPIDRMSARAMLRSLLVFLRACGRQGLFVAVDNLDDLMALRPEEYTARRYKYARAARTDAYESIRQLIDDVDEMKSACFLFAADALMLADQTLGLPSYNALWLRIQNEVVTAEFNPFADVIETRRIQAQWTPEHRRELVARLAALSGTEGVAAHVAGIALPTVHDLKAAIIQTLAALEQANMGGSL